jgi:RNA polymerase sigma-70 factor (ECF subfamily)
MTLAKMYEELEAPLRRYAMSLTHDSDKAADLVQETFIRTMAHLQLLEQLNGHQRRAWLYKVMKNLFIDEQRAWQRELLLVGQLTQEAELASYLSADSLSADAFDQVPERDRELLRQRYLLGMTSQEIARDLGIPAATVRSRLHLAVKRLRARKSQFL